MGLATPPEMRHLETVVNWCRVAVDSLAERLDIEGFRTNGSPEADQRMWSWWKHNRMQMESGAAHLESLIQGACFVVVGIDPKNPKMPRFTVESPNCMQVELDPTGREVTAALRSYVDSDGVHALTLYLPNSTIQLRQDSVSMGGWEETSRDDHNLGVVPVVPIVNRARITDRFGESEMTDVMTLVDAACRALTNLSAAGETLAVPSRYVFGVTEADFIDPATGEQVPKWEAYMGRLNAMTNQDGKVIQLDGADLANFREQLDLYKSLVSSVTGLPTHYLGLTTQTPASADAIRSGESRHVKRSERKQETLEDGWIRVMHIATLWVDGSVPEDFQIDVMWRDPSTPTIAAKTDAVVKLVAQKILPLEAAWIELGYSPEKRAQYRAMMSNDPLEKMLAAVGTGASDSAQGVNGDPFANVV